MKKNQGTWCQMSDLMNIVEYFGTPFILGDVPKYVNEFDDVDREYYPTLAAKQREIMESFTSDQYDQTYNAYENDIAVLYVYFGQPTTTEYVRFDELCKITFI